jgi:hypothetical protein
MIFEVKLASTKVSNDVSTTHCDAEFTKPRDAESTKLCDAEFTTPRDACDAESTKPRDACDAESTKPCDACDAESTTPRDACDAESTELLSAEPAKYLEAESTKRFESTQEEECLACSMYLEATKLSKAVPTKPNANTYFLLALEELRVAKQACKTQSSLRDLRETTKY